MVASPRALRWIIASLGVWLTPAPALSSETSEYLPSAVWGESRWGAAVFALERDSDGDGLSDKLEQELGTNLLFVDTDGDGLIDSEELTRDTDPLKSDTDGDGYLDGEEVLLGSNPGLNQDFPQSGLSPALLKILYDLPRQKQ